ncbi:unnamed protein product [Haemonchus placei]|uniref:G protein-coupled receptor n=1 Tax=Haemonchus placei TaxID=6290 RepID=A0A0N4WAS4_HAEPC|nr:unnamed protein product [Haemonchus placei]
MKDWVWWISMISNTTTNTIGVTANAFLLFVILEKTPQQLATYSVIFLNTAFCDLFACSTALLVRQRVIPTGAGIYFISYGPCTLFGPSVCYFIYAVMLHLFSHAIWGILFSFAYRYYIISHAPPKRSSIAVFLVLMYLPSFIQLVFFSLSSNSSEMIKEEIEEKTGYNVSSECVSGHIMDWKMNCVSAQMMLSTPIVFVSVLILRKRTISALNFGVVNVLTIQACLPMFYVIGAICHVLGQSDIYRHPLVESSFIFVAEPVPALNPFILLYSIGPYRLWVQGALRNIYSSLFSRPKKKQMLWQLL